MKDFIYEFKYKKILLFIVFLIVLCGVVGLSYALWIGTYMQEGSNKVASSCFNLSLTNEKNDIHLENAYPILDEEGKTLTPYSFTITNTCDLFASYTVNLEMLENTTLDSKYIRVMLNNEAIQNLNEFESTTTTLSGSVDSRILAHGSLGSGDSVDYTLRLWLDEDITMEDTEVMNTLFRSKVVISATVGTYSPTEQGYTTLADAILANEYQSTPEIAKQKISEKQTVDFTKTAPIIDWQESHAQTTSTTSPIMPHPDLVGNGESYTANLTSQNVLPTIGTGYTFNSETGKYDLTGYDYVDPTTLDYGVNDYYYCGSSFSTNGTNNDLISVSRSISNCTTIYKITGATKSEGITTGTGGTEIKTMVYRMTGYAYTQTELESDKSDKGLYQIEDVDGPSYYYRGTVTNNYVYFAGYYWRIIRINGDGSIRLLYAGETSDATGDNLNMKLTDSSLGYTNRTTSAFNSLRNDPAYVGYMYGNTFGSSYEETNANENDSAIKQYLDSWYRQNILDKGYVDYIADSGFCNDRSLSERTNNGDGVSTTERNTYYAGYTRFYETQIPSLVCPNSSNDLFTTTSSNKGNKALTYPIGLITVDELMLSGYANNYLNKSAYTFSLTSYWTMSPGQFIFSTLSAKEIAFSSGGYVYQWTNVTGNSGVRGVINLKGDTQISGGIGTANDPFVVD